MVGAAGDRRAVKLAVRHVMVVDKACLLQNCAAGNVLIGVDGGQPVCAHGVKPVVPHGTECLGGVAFIPPLAAQRIADLPGGTKAFGVQVPAHLQRRGGEEADRAKQHPGVLVGDAPLVKGRVIVVLFPLVQRLGGLAPAAVGVPAQVLGHLPVAGPVVEHHFAVVDGEPPQDQPLRFQLLCAAMLHVVALLSMEDAAQDAKAHAPEPGELCAVEGAVDKQNYAYQRKFYKEMLPQQRADGRDRERQQKAGDRLGVAGHRAVVHLPRDAAVQKRKAVAGGQRQRRAGQPERGHKQGAEPKVGQRPQPDANRVMPRLAGNRVAVDRALAQNVEHYGQHQQRENGKAAALVREDDKDDVLEHDQHAEEAEDQQIQHVMHAADALLLVAVMAVDVGPPVGGKARQTVAEGKQALGVLAAGVADERKADAAGQAEQNLRRGQRHAVGHGLARDAAQLCAGQRRKHGGAVFIPKRNRYNTKT